MNGFTLVVEPNAFSTQLLVESMDHILKASLSWSPTLAKFFQLNASLSVILPQFWQYSNLST